MISINLDGYFRDPKDLPPVKGIYVVSACKESINGICEARIIYIGKAENLRTRHYNNGIYCHEKLKEFKKELKSGEQLFYCYAEIEGRVLDKVENALIALQKPPLNNDLSKSYNHCAERFCIKGQGSDDFNFLNFGFRIDKDISSLYTEDEIIFE